MELKWLAIAVGVLIAIGCDNLEHVRRGAEALADLRANVGLEENVVSGCDVSLYRAPLVVKGVTIYKFSACGKSRVHALAVEMSTRLGMEKTDALKKFQSDFLSRIGSANKEFALNFTADDAYGMQLCPQGTASGDPVGLIAWVDQDTTVFLISYGGRLVGRPTNEMRRKLTDSCPVDH